MFEFSMSIGIVYTYPLQCIRELISELKEKEIND